MEAGVITSFDSISFHSVFNFHLTWTLHCHGNNQSSYSDEISYYTQTSFTSGNYVGYKIKTFAKLNEEVINFIYILMSYFNLSQNTYIQISTCNKYESEFPLYTLRCFNSLLSIWTLTYMEL